MNEKSFEQTIPPALYSSSRISELQSTARLIKHSFKDLRLVHDYITTIMMGHVVESIIACVD